MSRIHARQDANARSEQAGASHARIVRRESHRLIKYCKRVVAATFFFTGVLLVGALPERAMAQDGSCTFTGTAGGDAVVQTTCTIDVSDGSISGSGDGDAANEIAANSINEADITDDSITDSSIQDNSLTAASLADNSVGAGELADNSVDSEAIIDNEVNHDDIDNTDDFTVNSLTNTTTVNVGTDLDVDGLTTTDGITNDGNFTQSGGTTTITGTTDINTTGTASTFVGNDTGTVFLRSGDNALFLTPANSLLGVTSSSTGGT